MIHQDLGFDVGSVQDADLVYEFVVSGVGCDIADCSWLQGGVGVGAGVVALAAGDVDAEVALNAVPSDAGGGA